MYKLPEIKLYKEHMKKIREKHVPVIVFGNGMLGKAITDILLQQGIIIVGIFDNNKGIEGSSYREITVTLPQKNNQEDVVVIVSVYIYMQEITEQLKKLGYDNIYPYYCCFEGQKISEDFYWNNDASIQDALYLSKRQESVLERDAIEIDSLDIAITERCTLKCKNCANLIQYYTKPQHDVFEKNSRALERLIQCVELIGRISILGGEPLICDDVARYVKACRQTEKIANILVVTNGTILPSEELMKELAGDERCVLSVSDYGSLSKCKKEIIELSRKHRFKMAVSRRETGIWRELGRIDYQELTEKELESKWNDCMMKKYLSIKDGKLFVCPFAANAYSLQAIAEKDVDYVDLLDRTTSEEELQMKVREFINRCNHPECRYCIEKGKNARLIPAAEQTKQPLPYKRYEYVR